ncbi:putative membrane protein [Enterobacteriaceae bacterium ATCC 29904]|nr:putative membrane protein [Enterobacteriaceae bacterium ATCC 29904]
MLRCSQASCQRNFIYMLNLMFFNFNVRFISSLSLVN